MLNLTCTCGERYRSEESYIGSFIRCRRCGTLILIRYSAPLLDGQSFAQNPGTSSFAPKIGGIRSRKLVAFVFAAVVLVVASLVALKASAPRPQSSKTPGQPFTTGESAGTENQPRTPRNSTDRPLPANQAQRDNPSFAPRIEPIKVLPTITHRIEPANLMDRGEPRAKKENPRLASEVEASNPRTLPLG